jgi:hypothetical protein
VKVEFGDISRIVESGTETVFLLKVTDEHGSEFRFLLGKPSDYNREIEDDLAYHFHEWTTPLGYDDE